MGESGDRELFWDGFDRGKGRRRVKAKSLAVHGLAFCLKDTCSDKFTAYFFSIMCGRHRV